MPEIFCNNQYPSLRYTELELQHLFDTLHDIPGFCPPTGEFSIAFLSDDALAAIHAEFLNDPTPTDVITFPGDPDDDLAGEICVSVDMALRISSEATAPLPFHEELTLYLAHGWLHLCGLCDLEDTSREEMRNAEKIVMDYLREKQSIPAFSIVPEPKSK